MADSDAGRAIILLDVDGVLHPLRPSGHALYASMDDLTARADEELDLPDDATGRTVAGEFLEENMAALHHIVSTTGAAIVLSSTWRETAPQRRAVDVQLIKHGIAPHVGCTPRLPMVPNGGRAAEILAWAAEHATGGVAWVALDDLELTGLPKSCFVQMDPAVGLTRLDADRVIACLQQQKQQEQPPPPTPPPSPPMSPSRIRVTAVAVEVEPIPVEVEPIAVEAIEPADETTDTAVRSVVARPSFPRRAASSASAPPAASTTRESPTIEESDAAEQQGAPPDDAPAAVAVGGSAKDGAPHVQVCLPAPDGHVVASVDVGGLDKNDRLRAAIKETIRERRAEVRADDPTRLRARAASRGGVPLVTGGDRFFENLCNHWDNACAKFMRLDQKSGELDELKAPEFLRWMRVFGTPPEEARQVFEHIDQDGSGSVQLNELLSVAQAYQAARSEGLATEAWDMVHEYVQDHELSKLRRRIWRGEVRRMVRTCGEFALGFLWRNPPDLAAALDKSVAALDALHITVSDEDIQYGPGQVTVEEAEANLRAQLRSRDRDDDEIDEAIEAIKRDPNRFRDHSCRGELARCLSEEGAAGENALLRARELSSDQSPHPRSPALARLGRAATVDAHAATFERHLDSTENELLHETEALVEAMVSLRDRIEIERLETKTLGAVFPQLCTPLARPLPPPILLRPRG